MRACLLLLLCRRARDVGVDPAMRSTSTVSTSPVPTRPCRSAGRSSSCGRCEMARHPAAELPAHPGLARYVRRFLDRRCVRRGVVAFRSSGSSRSRSSSRDRGSTSSYPGSAARAPPTGMCTAVTWLSAAVSSSSLRSASRCSLTGATFAGLALGGRCVVGVSRGRARQHSALVDLLRHRRSTRRGPDHALERSGPAGAPRVYLPAPADRGRHHRLRGGRRDHAAAPRPCYCTRYLSPHRRACCLSRRRDALQVGHELPSYAAAVAPRRARAARSLALGARTSCTSRRCRSAPPPPACC